MIYSRSAEYAIRSFVYLARIPDGKFAMARHIAEEEAGSGSAPDESAIREMAILIAVELVLKMQEASIPGGVTLSRHLLEDAARTAIARIQLVEARLDGGGPH